MHNIPYNSVRGTSLTIRSGNKRGRSTKTTAAAEGLDLKLVKAAHINQYLCPAFEKPYFAGTPLGLAGNAVELRQISVQSTSLSQQIGAAGGRRFSVPE